MIEDLQAFVAVVEAASLSRAASRLHITQSAVSRRLQQLESRLDGTLLDRTHRPPLLTPLGARVYESAKTVLQQVDSLVSLADERSEPSGPFRLGFSIGLGDGVLERVVERLHEDFPRVRLQVRSDWGRGLIERVEANALDAAIVLAPTSDSVPSSLVAETVGAVDLVIVQSRDQMPYRRPVRLGALASANWVLNPTGCGYRAAIEAAMGKQNASLQVAIDASGSELQLRLVAKGIGLGLVPRVTLLTSQSAQAVHPVGVTDFNLALDVRLTHHRETGPFKAVLAAINAYAASALTA